VVSLRKPHEIELRQRSLELAVDKEIFDRKVTNWSHVDEARSGAIQQRVTLGIEIGTLEARKALLTEINVQKDAIIGMKDAEIGTLKTLLTEAIKALQAVHIKS
jgi:hypothetical protein